MAKHLFILLLLSSFLPSHPSFGQELKRRANIAGSFNFLSREKGVVVGQNIFPTSDLLTQGLQKGDSVILFNGKNISNELEWEDMRARFREGEQYELTVKRGDKTFKQPIKFTALPKENWPSIQTEYTSIQCGGKNVRVIVTYPIQSTNAVQPALFILSGLSCSTMELSGLPRLSGCGLLLKDLVTKSNTITVRVEKFGVGYSEGVCSETDFNTEMEIYRTALRELLQNKRVDPKKVVLFGSSMGSMQSAILANEFPVKAIVASGTFLKSWYEHMLEIERRIMEMSGLSFSAIQDRSMKYAELYYDAMVRGKTFKEIVQENPHLKEVYPGDDAHLYGRPLSYYRQLQQINIPAQWEKIKVPVLIHYGTNDWIMSEDDNQILIRLLTRSKVDFTYFPVEGMDHNYFLFKNEEEAFKSYWTGKPDETFTEKILQWISACLTT